MTEALPLPARPPQDRRPKIAILDDWLDSARAVADWRAVEARADVTTFSQPFASQAEAAAALAGFDVLVLMRERTPMPASLIRALPDLRMIAMTGPRNLSLDLRACAEAGILVCATGGAAGGSASTSELAWGLILGLTRRLPEQDAGMRAGQWQRHLGRTLHGRRLGLVGLGKLGQRMVPVARAFDMDVVAWSPNLTAERAEAAGARAVPKEELMATSDVISLHMVLSAATRGLIGAADLARMKPDAVIVNTSRGPLIDTPALLTALEEGRIGGAGLDVFDEEPLPADHPLRRAPDTVLSPHLGFTVEETLAAYYRQSVENILAWLDGAPIRVMKAD